MTGGTLDILTLDLLFAILSQESLLTKRLSMCILPFEGCRIPIKLRLLLVPRRRGQMHQGNVLSLGINLGPMNLVKHAQDQSKKLQLGSFPLNGSWNSFPHPTHSLANKNLTSSNYFDDTA